MRGRPHSRVLALALLGLGLVACELVRPLPDVNAEQGDTLCHDQIENDGDGLVDCDDPSCGVGCATAPVIVCPQGWSRRDIGDSEWFTCDPPRWSPADGCPSEPPSALPAGAVVVSPHDDLGAIAFRSEHQIVALGVTARAAEVWLRPGVYDVSAADFGALHALIAHGLCDRSGWPVLRGRVPGDVPLHALERIQMDHVELRLPPRDTQLVESDLLRLEDARITIDERVSFARTEPPPRLQYLPAESGGAAIELQRVEVDPALEIYTLGVRVQILDASIGPLHAINSATTLDHVAARAAFDYDPSSLPTGSPTRGRYEQYYAVYADGPASTLSADAVFVTGVLAGYAGPSVTLTDVVVEGWRIQVTALFQQGTTDPFPALGSFSAQDVVVAGEPPPSICNVAACSGISSQSSCEGVAGCAWSDMHMACEGRERCWSAMHIKAPSDVARVAIVGTTGGASFIGCGTLRDVLVDDVARAHAQPWSGDPAVPWPSRAVGLAIGPGVSLERARIRSAGYAGLAVLQRWPDVAGLTSATCGANASVHIDRVAIEGAGEPALGTTCSGTSVGVLIYDPYDVSVSNARVSGVDCGVAIRSGAGVLLSGIEVDHGTAALCGTADLARLATGVVTDGATPPYSTVLSTEPSVCQ